MRVSKTVRGVAMTTVAALAMTAVELTPAAAADRVSIAPAGVEQAGVNDVSARKRQRSARHYRQYRGNAAGLRTFGAIAGTIGGIIAAEQANRYYRRQYNPYYGQPYGYYGQPYGYYGQPYGYYGQPYGSYGYYPY